MINLLILIAVVVAFARAATARNQNQLTWGLIGGASYIVPSSLVFELVLKKMLAGPPGTMPSQAGTILFASSGVLAGLICCFAAYKFLLSWSGDRT